MYKSNAIFMPTFSGPIAVQLTGFLQEKRALGYKYTSESWRLLQIDCLSRELKTEPNTLPQELIDTWRKRTPSESNKTWHARITVTAQLTKYFIAHDLPCAKTIIQTENTCIGSNFVPYIFLIPKLNDCSLQQTLSFRHCTVLTEEKPPHYFSECSIPADCALVKPLS